MASEPWFLLKAVAVLLVGIGLVPAILWIGAKWADDSHDEDPGG